MASCSQIREDRALITSINKQEFVTKDEYLAWRKLWKETYKMLTEMSRANRRLKAEMKALHDQDYETRMNQYHWNRMNIRWYANSMMEALVEAKAKSWELRNKALETKRVSNPILDEIPEAYCA